MTEDTAKITDEILIEYKKLLVIRWSLKEANKKYRNTDYGKEQTRNIVLKSKQEISYWRAVNGDDMGLGPGSRVIVGAMAMSCVLIAYKATCKRKLSVSWENDWRQTVEKV